jgi:hypothetical protein
MCAIGRLAGELLRVFLLGIVGFFATLLLAAGTILVWLIGCVSALFLMIAVAEAVWWLHSHSHHAAITTLGYFGYAAGTFALIPVLFWSKEKLTGWRERHRVQRVPCQIHINSSGVRPRPSARHRGVRQHPEWVGTGFGLVFRKYRP